MVFEIILTFYNTKNTTGLQQAKMFTIVKNQEVEKDWTQCCIVSNVRTQLKSSKFVIHCQQITDIYAVMTQS